MEKTETKLLSDLLAIIHRDGGHYEKDHGTDQAVADAKDKVCRLQAENEKLVSDITRIGARCESIRRIMEETETAAKARAATACSVYSVRAAAEAAEKEAEMAWAAAARVAAEIRAAEVWAKEYTL